MYHLFKIERGTQLAIGEIGLPFYEGVFLKVSQGWLKWKPKKKPVLGPYCKKYATLRALHWKAKGVCLNKGGLGIFKQRVHQTELTPHCQTLFTSKGGIVQGKPSDECRFGSNPGLKMFVILKQDLRDL